MANVPLMILMPKYLSSFKFVLAMPDVVTLDENGILITVSVNWATLIIGNDN